MRPVALTILRRDGAASGPDRQGERRVANVHRGRYLDLNRSGTARRHSGGVRARRSRHRNDDVGDRKPVERPFDRALAGAVQLPMGALAAEVAGEVEGKINNAIEGQPLSVCGHGTRQEGRRGCVLCSISLGGWGSGSSRYVADADT